MQFCKQPASATPRASFGRASKGFLLASTAAKAA